jgi:hypothetical protein
MLAAIRHRTFGRNARLVQGRPCGFAGDPDAVTVGVKYLPVDLVNRLKIRDP